MKAREMRPDAVAIYIRWSTEEQGEGTTLEVQRERCSLFVRSQGWQVRDDLIFVDDGYSGASLARPAMQRLREAVQADAVSCVVSYRLDRLSRNLLDTVSLVRHEWAGKCIYRSATEGFDTSSESPTGGLIFNILASFAEFERAVIYERTHGGLMRRRKEGMYITGQVPYGYERIDKGRYRPKPGQTETVARIFDLATNSVTASATGIARLLNAEGIPSPNGGKWWTNVVEGILRNPIYVGDVVYGRDRMSPLMPGGYGRYDSDAEPLVQVEGAMPAIISRETFERAHTALMARKQSKPRQFNRSSEVYLLSSIARCRCGSQYAAIRDRTGKVWYRCSRQQRGVGCAVRSVTFPSPPVEEQIVAALLGRFGGAGREQALAVIRQEIGSVQRLTELNEAVKAVERRRESITQELARMRRQVRQGELKPGTYEELKQDAEADLRQLEERLRELKVQQAAAGRMATDLERYEQIINATNEWEALSPGDRKSVLRALCKRLVVYYPGKNKGELEIEIEWVG